MCGICGIYNYKNSDHVSEELVKDMMNQMVHRGPDDDGVFFSGNICMGMRRLSILDVAHGKQPISNETNDVHIVFNGEIYNYLPLMDELKKKGHIFKTKCDTEVIVHLYEEYGTKSFEMLNGMFAFSIWDKRKEAFYLVRDRFGIKPLVYADLNGKIIYGSEIHLLFNDKSVTKEIDPAALNFYLAYYYINAPRTIYKNIKKLPSASYLEIKNGETKIERYWVPGSKKVEFKDEEELKELFRQTMSESVKMQLQSEVPLGVMLSGGLDSTTILAYMNEHMNEQVKTFSIGFDEGTYNELPEANMVAKMFKTDHHPYVMTADKIPELLPKVIHNMGEPNGDWSFAANYLVSQEARKKVTVVLRGDGGDELFGGYPTYNAAKIVKKLRLIPSFFRNGVMKKVIHALPVSHKRLSFDYKAKKLIEGVDLSQLEAHFSWKEIFKEENRNSLLNNGYKMENGRSMIVDELQSVVDEYSNGTDIEKLMYLDLRVFDQGCTLPVSDIASMAVSLEGRVPFLDNNMADLAFSIPEDMKIRGMETKYIFRKAMESILPPEITKMKKKGFVVPGATWINNELKPYITDILSESRIKQMTFLNYEPVKVLLDEHFSMKKDNTRQITCLTALSIWYENN